MLLKPLTCMTLTLALLLATACLAEEPPKPVPVEQKNPPPVAPVVPAVPVAPVAPSVRAPRAASNSDAANMGMLLSDLQSDDKQKQEAATKGFVEIGLHGYQVVATLLKNPNPDVAARATEVRKQIDARSWQMFQEVMAANDNLQKAPLTPQALEQVRDAWLKVSSYASQPAVRQNALQNAQAAHQKIQQVGEASKVVAVQDLALQAAPEPQGLARAAIQLQRADALKTLQRDADALAAAHDAAKASGPGGRHTSAALKHQAEIYTHMEDRKALEAVCKQILQEYPRTLEAAFAYSSLVKLYTEDHRWDEALKAAQQYMQASPLEEDAQDSAYTLLDSLMDEEHDYKRALTLAEWLMENLPVQRLKAEAPKAAGGINEYLMKDYAKAEKAYRLIQTQFADEIQPSEMSAVLARVKFKAEGKFPHEPAAADAGPAGAFARFLQAVRSQDDKAISAAVPAAKAEDFVSTLKDGVDETIASVTFSDFILTKAEADEAKGTATLFIDHYEAATDKPEPIQEQAILENGQWKIDWQSPDDADKPEKTEMPAAKTPEPGKK